MPKPYEEGDPKSRILFLGQAPARVEMRLGRPLVGPSGDVFNDCIRAEGIARNQSYILNVWEESVYTDRQGNIWTDGTMREGEMLWSARHGLTDAGLEAAEPCMERIRRSDANVIVTFGQQAMQFAVGGQKRPMMKWRGSLIEGAERVGRRKVLPTIHPAATLHGTYLWRYMIMADLRKAKGEGESAELSLPQRDLFIWPGFSEVLNYIDKCRSKGIVATDLEVINHQVSCLSLCFDPIEAMTVPFMNQDGSDYWSEDEEMQIWSAYASLMGDPSVQKINQNLIGFDAPFLLVQNGIFTRGFMGDTMIAQHIMYPEFPKGLDFITSIRTREPYYKDEGKMWKGYGGDIEEFWRYCGKDACVALEAWHDLAEEMETDGYWTAYEMTASLADSLMYMSARGFAVDREALNDTKTDIEQRIAEKESELEEASDYKFNPNSSAQCKKYFYEHKKCHPYTNAQGGITTDDKALSRIYRRYNLPEAKLVQDLRNLKKLKSTYLDVQLDHDGRLRCSWNPRGTWTGRLSSSATVFGTGMNLQNLDPRFNNFIVADPDHASHR